MVDATPTRTARPLKVGVTLPISEGSVDGETPGWSEILALAQTAEAAGFDSVWVPDHMIFKPTPDSTTPIGIWECFSLISALAVGTRRVYRIDPK